MTGAQSIEYTNKIVIVRSYLITLAIFQSAHADLVSCFAVESLFFHSGFSSLETAAIKIATNGISRTIFLLMAVTLHTFHTLGSSIFRDKGEFSCDCDGCCKRIRGKIRTQRFEFDKFSFLYTVLKIVREKLKLFPQQRLMLNF